MTRRTTIRRTLLLVGLAFAAPPAELRADAPATAPATRQARPIAEGDRLAVKIKGLDVPNESSTKLVKVEDGQIQMPLLNPLPVKGLTPAEAADRLGDAYDDARIIQKGYGEISIKRVPPTAADFAALTADDPIRSGERVSVTVMGLAKPDELLTVVRRIGPSGTFAVPYAGDVKLLGLKPAEAQRAVVDAFVAANVFSGPNCLVIVVLPDRGESVTVGAVPRTPGAPPTTAPTPPAER